MLEVIVENERDAIEAASLGVSRIELVSAIQLGGLTPTYGTIKRTIESARLPIQIMIRPHSYSFVYSLYDKKAMIEDIAFLYDMGHYRIVIGALNEDKSIDIQFLEDIFNEFPKLDVTFHRAIDEATDIFQSYHNLIPYSDNIKRVLTSGGKKSCMEGAYVLQKLVRLQHDTDGPIILPGSGMNIENIKEMNQIVRADQYHFGSGVRKNRSFENGFDKEIINKIAYFIRNG